MSKQKVKMKGVMERDRVISYLEELIVSLRAGKLCIQQGDQHVILCPDEMLNIRVEAAATKGKEKFELALSWRSQETPICLEDMRITSEPQIAADEAGTLPDPGGPDAWVSPDSAGRAKLDDGPLPEEQGKQGEEASMEPHAVVSGGPEEHSHETGKTKSGKKIK